MAEPKNESKESRFAKWVASVPWRGGRWDLLLWLVAIFVGVFFGANWVFFARLIPLIRSSLAAEAFKDPGSIAQLVTGLLTFWAGIALAAMWVWRNAISAKEAETSRIQAKVALNTQISTDLTKAYEQLGSDKMAVRIGAIYTLEKVMRDVQDTDFNLYWSIIETLSGFARYRSIGQREKLDALDEAFIKADMHKDLESKIKIDRELETLDLENIDICEAVAVLADGRYQKNNLVNLRKIYARNFNSNRSALNFSNIDISDAYFGGAKFNNAIFDNTIAEGIVFSCSHINQCTFKNGWFPQAVFNHAVIEYSTLNKFCAIHGKFRGVRMLNVDASEAELLNAVFEGGTFHNVSIAGAGVWNADLRVGGLTQQQVDLACGASNTQLPPDLSRPSEWKDIDLAATPIGPKGAGLLSSFVQIYSNETEPR